MRVEATLRIEGEGTWVHDAKADVPEGLGFRGERPGEIDLFFNGRKIGYLLEYPRFIGEGLSRVGSIVPFIEHTEVRCVLELEALAT